MDNDTGTPNEQRYVLVYPTLPPSEPDRDTLGNTHPRTLDEIAAHLGYWEWRRDANTDYAAMRNSKPGDVTRIRFARFDALIITTS